MNAFIPTSKSTSTGSFYFSFMESLWSTISSLVVVVDGGGGNDTSSSSSSSSDVLVNLPYIGPAPLPFVVFVGSAIMFRVSQFWRQQSTRPTSSSSSPKKSNPRSSGCRGGVDGSYASPSFTNKNNTTRKSVVIVADSKAKTYKVSAYTNQNQQALNQFMEKARNCKQQLRHVDDPERVRQAKICQIRKQQRQQHCAAAANDPLQLSETKLLEKLSSLKKTNKKKYNDRKGYSKYGWCRKTNFN